MKKLMLLLLLIPSPALACDLTDVYTLTRQYHGARLRYEEARLEIFRLASDLSYCRGIKNLPRNFGQEYISTYAEKINFSTEQITDLCNWPLVESYAQAAEETERQFRAELIYCEGR